MFSTKHVLTHAENIQHKCAKNHWNFQLRIIQEIRNSFKETKIER